MSVPVKLWGTDGGYGAAVTEDEALLSCIIPYPPMLMNKTIPFRQHMTDDGLPIDGAGNEDMQRVGTLAAPVEFCIPAHPTRDRWISTLSFEIVDASASLNKFGNITALTNGCRLFYNHSQIGEVDLHDALKSNWDFIRFASGQPAFGQTANAFRANNVSGTSEGFIPVVDLRTFSSGFGIKLDAGTTQRLVLQVRDTTTGVDAFDCIAYGFDRIP